MPAADALTFRTQLYEEFRLPMFDTLIGGYLAYDGDNKREWVENMYRQIRATEGQGLGEAARILRAGGEVDQETLRKLADSYDEVMKTGAQSTFSIQASGTHELYDTPAMQHTLDVAENYYVSPDMHRLAMQARKSFPEDEVIMREDQPSPQGLIWLAEPWRQMGNGMTMLAVHGAMWNLEAMWLFVDRLSKDDTQAVITQAEGRTQQYIDQVGRWDVAAMMRFEFGKPVPKSIHPPNSILEPDAKLSITPKDGNVAIWTDQVMDIAKDGVLVEEPDGFMLYMLSIWRLMQQSLADVREERPDRGTRRRAQKVGVTDHKVTVIALRRIERHYEPGDKHIDYRYLRRGHWRRVWCGKKDGTEERYQRAVWIDPVICGPEGAPLIVRKKVNALLR